MNRHADSHEAMGMQLVELLNLKQARDNDGRRFTPPRYNTTYGTKTAIGLYLTIQRIIFNFTKEQ